VYFLNPPDPARNNIDIQPVQSHPGLYVVSASMVARGLRFFPSGIRRHIEKRWLDEFEATAGATIDVIWLFENSRFFDLRFAGRRLKIYHQVDLNQDFNLAVAARTADICFCTSDFIQQRLRAFNKRVYKIHHGLPVTASTCKLSDDQAENLARNTVNAVYIGNLDMAYLDAELLRDVVTSFEDVHFHFVGDYSAIGQLWRLCRAIPNITWWGKVDSSLIPAILLAADILLVTYKAERWRGQLASPHKFLEYLGSGKTIVATYTDEYKDKRHLLKMVDSRADYIGAFREVAGNLNEYNSPERMERRISFAMDNTYGKQVQRINDCLATHNLPTLT